MKMALLMWCAGYTFRKAWWRRQIGTVRGDECWIYDLLNVCFAILALDFPIFFCSDFERGSFNPLLTKCPCFTRPKSHPIHSDIQELGQRKYFISSASRLSQPVMEFQHEPFDQDPLVLFSELDRSFWSSWSKVHLSSRSVWRSEVHW